ncbi:MAG: class I SAM-dependent methyltransferase [Polyangiaceae bacterium]|nr:class I SAM-dependent methyltransferase [Polyangiaceae bacterium]
MPDVSVASAARRYRRCEPRHRWYARCKYHLDPIYAVAAGHARPGTRTLDLGAGLNLLAVLLHELGEGRRAEGVERDGAKVGAARRAAPEVPIVEADLVDLPPLEPADLVTLIDVLHCFPAAAVERVLDAACALLAPRGTLLVRETTADSRAGWTRTLERVAIAAGWNAADEVRFFEAGELCARLESRGLVVSERDVSGPLHPGNRLYVARRRASVSAA